MVQVADRAVNTTSGQSLESHRERARAVLAELLQARTACEEQGSRMNRSDLYKNVTGRSALDTAIASTQRMIDSLDRSLGKAALEVEVRASTILARQKSPAR